MLGTQTPPPRASPPHSNCVVLKGEKQTNFPPLTLLLALSLRMESGVRLKKKREEGLLSCLFSPATFLSLPPLPPHGYGRGGAGSREEGPFLLLLLFPLSLPLKGLLPAIACKARSVPSHGMFLNFVAGLCSGCLLHFCHNVK